VVAASAARAGTAAAAAATEQAVWQALAAVADPEIPVLSIVDLGIVRRVTARPGEPVRVALTPTYSGCPATEVIRAQVQAALAARGFAGAVLEEELTPPWTSEWLSEAGRAKLAAYGIAPPAAPVTSLRALHAPRPVACPRCGSLATECLSEFGSTPCKAHHRCRSCAEPFDYFKCL
jgi:ring-1,2-phenylacetyl-CoA epoxidase subunit PaaD